MTVRAVFIELWKKITPYKEQEKVFWNGADNMYSSEIELAVGNSPTGSRCREMFSKFVFGKGLTDDVNKKFADGVLLSEVVKDVVDDVVVQNGAFIHTTYKIEDDGQGGFLLLPDQPKSLDYNKCRISKPDDDGNEGMILYKNFNRNDASLTRQEKDYKRKYYPFNPIQSVVMAQIEADAKDAGYKGEDLAGKMKHYRGQVMYLNLTPKHRYAISKFDSVYSDLDTEYRISTYFNTSTRGGFLGKFAILFQGLDDEKTKEMEAIVEKWIGEKGNSGVAMFAVGEVEDLSKVMHTVQIPTQLDDKQFSALMPHLRRNILGAANNLPEGLAFANDAAMFAGSGESYIQMKKIYWEQCEWERQKVEEAFWKLGYNFNLIDISNGNNVNPE